MSAAIMNFIFGVPITEQVNEWFQEHDQEPKDQGFKTYYTANGPWSPGYLGFELGHVTEGTDPVLMRVNDKEVNGDRGWFSVQPTSEQMVELEVMIASLPRDLKDALEPIGVYIVWSTT
jgi:hypothetical protein